MYASSKLSNLILRLGLAAVFLWFGIDKFIRPEYWLNAWVPQWALTILSHLSLGGTQFILITGVFEILVGLSLLSNVLVPLFSSLAVIFLIAVIFASGLTEVTVRDMGLIAGLVSLFFWPASLRRF